MMTMEEEKERLKAKTVIKSIFSGDILLLLRVDKLLPYILVLFVLGWVNIFINYKIEQTMVQVEKNQNLLNEYKVYHAQKTYEYVMLSRISTVEGMLGEAGSEVTAPQKPAYRLKER